MFPSMVDREESLRRHPRIFRRIQTASAHWLWGSLHGAGLRYMMATRKILAAVRERERESVDLLGLRSMFTAAFRLPTRPTHLDRMTYLLLHHFQARTKFCTDAIEP